MKKSKRVAEVGTKVASGQGTNFSNQNYLNMSPDKAQNSNMPKDGEAINLHKQLAGTK